MRKLFSKFKKPSGGDLSSPHSVGSGSIVAAEHGAGGVIQTGQANNNNIVTSPNSSNLITPATSDVKQRKMSTAAMGMAKARPGAGGGWTKLLVCNFDNIIDFAFKIISSSLDCSSM